MQKATKPNVNLERVIELVGWLKAATYDVKVEKESMQVKRKKLKEPTERLDILRKQKIAPKTDMQLVYKNACEKAQRELSALETKQEDMEASLGLQQDMCEEMVEIMKGLVVKLGKCTEMDNVRQLDINFRHELSVFRAKIATVNLIYPT